jgi:hypothetical protein
VKDENASQLAGRHEKDGDEGKEQSLEEQHTQSGVQRGKP